ncbi:hypothetical protein MXB_524, partial [Myxobolus squamalis]
MADAVLEVASRDSKSFTGNLLTDEEILLSSGKKDFKEYSYPEGANKLLPALYIDDNQKINDSTRSTSQTEYFNIEFIDKANKIISDGDLDNVDIIFNIRVNFENYYQLWYIDLNSPVKGISVILINRGCFVGNSENSDLTLSGDFMIFKDIIRKKVNPFVAYLSGQLIVK